jgi:hypothetical protein
MQTEPLKDAPPNSGPPQRKRRRFQFSLRILLIFTRVCAIGTARRGGKIEQKHSESARSLEVCRILALCGD